MEQQKSMSVRFRLRVESHAPRRVELGLGGDGNDTMSWRP